MNNFELTERGKIVIAVVLVVILLVIPAVIILGISSCSGSTGTPPDGTSLIPTPPQSPVYGESPIILNPSPSQDNVAGSSGAKTPEPETAPEQTATPEPSPTPASAGDDGNADPPEHGPVGLNISLGTMQFIFSLEDQVALDDETAEMINDFLLSPRNTSGSLIKVEIPSLSDEDEALLRSAVAEAFSRYNVAESRLLYAGSGLKPSEQRFEVALSFTTISNQK